MIIRFNKNKEEIKVKKILINIIFLTMLVLLVACGGTPEPAPGDDGPTEANVEAPAEKADAPAEEPTEAPTATPTEEPTATPEPVEETVPMAAEPARNEVAGVAIAYPDGWETMDMLGMLLLTPSMANMQSEEDAAAVMVMGIVGADFEEAGITSLADIENDLDSVIGQTTQGMEVISSETVQMGGQEALVLDVAGVEESSGMEMNGRVAVTVLEDRAVLVVGMGAVSAWEEIAPSFEAMLNSVTFFEPTETLEMGLDDMPPVEDNWTMTLGEVQDDVELVSESHYVDSLGNLWVAVEVRNTSDTVMGEPKVLLNIGDYVQEYGTTVTKIEPGESVPTQLHVSADDIPAGITEYTLDLVGTEPLDDFSAGYYYSDFEIANDDFGEGQFFDQAVVGELTNTGDRSAEFVHVVAAFYDEDGTIIQVGDNYVDVDMLAAGESAEFSVDFESFDQIAATYQLWVEGIGIEPEADSSGTESEAPAAEVEAPAEPTATPVPPAPAAPADNPFVPQAGRSKLYVFNEFGQEITIDINSQAYKIAPGTPEDGIYIDLDPGKYTYTLSIPGGAANGEVELGADQAWGFGVRGDGAVYNPMQLYP
jgi:hypothetical protein